MIRAIFYLFRIAQENGIVLTLGLANLGLVAFSFWKLFKNHLTHINETLEDNGKKIDNIDKDVRDLGQRVARVEGKLAK